MLIIVSLWCVTMWQAEAAILDPSLFLSPSPPLIPLRDSAPGNLWSQKRTQRDVEDLSVLPILQKRQLTPARVTLETTSGLDLASHFTEGKQKITTTTEQQETMESAETFWPGLRTTRYNFGGFGGIHIPLTFGLSGTYGRYGTIGSTGVIGSAYGSISDDSMTYGKSGLAGSGYGSYTGYPGTRIYGSNGAAAWSGWGNGKWGHYGKG